MLSAALSLTILVVFWKTAWRANIVLKLGFSVFALWLFVWLSPQAYYTYYLFLFDGLEFKNVIKSPPTMTEMFSLLTFSDRANFSNHGKALLGWGLIMLSILGSRGHRRCKSQPREKVLNQRYI
jgi:hypothetical protein